jgi:hypothetical protein
MHDERSKRPLTPLTDEALDGEIARALAVDPSPEFVARIRQCVASEPAPTAWRFSWTVYAGGLAAAAAIALVVVSRGTQPAMVSPAARAIPAIGRLPHVTSALGRTTHDAAIRSILPSPAVPSVARREPASDPEVIVDVREANALRALIAGASHERVDAAPLVALLAEMAAPLQPSEIVVSPITIEPLVPDPGGEGVRQ